MSRSRDSAWPRSVTGRDGTIYRIRAITPEDRDRERAFIAGLSPESRYRRFLHAIREPTPAFVEQLVTVDGHREMAYVAVIGDGPEERIIGVARYAADANGPDCEFAVIVGDEWQGRGIGTTLAHTLFEHARTHGFRMIYGDIQPDNDRMLALAMHLDLEIEPPRPKVQTRRAYRVLN